MLTACRERDAAAILRITNRQCGISQARLGFHIDGIDGNEISKVIRRKVGGFKTLERWERLAQALNMPDHARVALGLAPRNPGSAPRPEPATQPPQARPDWLTEPEPTVTSQPPAAPGLLPGVPLPVPLTDARSGDVVDALDQLLIHYCRADNTLGPRALTAAVASHLLLISHLQATTRTATDRQRLFGLGARYAEFAGWLYQDSGDVRAAEYWTDRGLEWAHIVGEPTLIAYILMRKSNQASSLLDGPRTLGLAETAAAMPAIRPRVRALIMRQVARGHALLQAPDDCSRALDAAREYATQDDHDKDGILTEYCTFSYIRMQEAHCLLILGRADQAIQIFEEQLATWPADFRRDGGVHLARLALAYSTNGDPDAACHRAQEALTAARETGSGRAMRELHRLNHQLDRWAESAPVRALREAVTAIDPPGQ